MTRPPGLRVLLHKPLLRATEPYFRAQQYLAALTRLGHRPAVLDFGRLSGPRPLRAARVALQLAASARAFRRADVVVMSPHPLVPAYLALAHALGRRVVLDQILTYVAHREVFPRYPLALDRWTYRRADAILTHSETMRRELVTTFGLDPDAVSVAYPVVDLAVFSRRYAEPAQAVRRALGLDDRFVVLYHGMWHPWHGLPHLYEAARRLEGRRDIAFVVIPKDGEPDRVNLRYVEEQPFERLPVYLEMADAWASGFDTDVRGERAFSSTLIQALAMGVPVITGAAGERAAALRDGVEARLVPLRDPQAIADAVLALAADRAAARAMGARARAFAEAHFALERLDRALEAALARAAAPRRRPGNA